MIRVKIQGGLGNQLFQYAYGRRLELSGNKVIFDTSFYHGNKAAIDTSRDFKLFNFNIESRAEFSNKKRLLADLMKKVLAKLRVTENGFWQNEKYFKSIEGEIRKEFTLKSPLGDSVSHISDMIVRSTNSISVHIRRGDYANDMTTNDYWGTCDIDYYKKALAHITSKIGSDVHIFIFSDDIEWVKQNMTFGYTATYVSSPNIKDFEELHLMSLCRNHIIANSSFSWWGAWLDPKSDKIVVAPKDWSRKQAHLYRDIIPKEWVTI